MILLTSAFSPYTSSNSSEKRRNKKKGQTMDNRKRTFLVIPVVLLVCSFTIFTSTSASIAHARTLTHYSPTHNCNQDPPIIDGLGDPAWRCAVASYAIPCLNERVEPFLSSNPPQQCDAPGTVL